METKMEEYLKLPLFSERFKEVLENLASRKASIVALAMLHIQECIDCDFLPDHEEYNNIESIRMLDLRKSDDFYCISFLPLGKEPQYTEHNKWARKGRQDGKIGKVIRTFITPYLHLMNTTITDSEIEEFVNDSKVAMSAKFEFKLVSGEDIRHYYCEDQYAEGRDHGTLWNSCMRHHECQKYFDIYTDTKECEMLIMIDPSFDSQKIVGRALVWNYNGQKYVDRRYYILDFHEVAMINYIKTQGWNYKARNTYEEEEANTFYLYKNGTYYMDYNVELSFKVNRYDYYPYMDTLKWLNTNTWILSNKIDSGGILNSTEGYGPNNEIECQNCGAFIDADSAYYIRGRYYCEECICTDFRGDVELYDDCTEVIYNRNGWTHYVHNSELDEVAVEYDGRYYMLPESGYTTKIIDISDLTEEELEELVESGDITVLENNPDLAYRNY